MCSRPSTTAKQIDQVLLRFKKDGTVQVSHFSDGALRVLKQITDVRTYVGPDGKLHLVRDKYQTDLCG